MLPSHPECPPPRGLPVGGTMTRSDWGRTIRQNVSQPFIPRACAASDWCRGTDSSPPRTISALGVVGLSQRDGIAGDHQQGGAVRIHVAGVDAATGAAAGGLLVHLSGPAR